MVSIINDNKLDIEDLAYHINIPIDEILEYDLETFKQKVKRLNYKFKKIFR